MFEIVFGLILIFAILLPIAVYTHAKESGRDPFFWAIIVFLFSMPGLLLYIYDIHKESTELNNNTPTLQVSCTVINANTKKQQKMGIVVNTNDMEKAKQRFRNACAKKGFVLTEEPSVEIL